MIKVVYFDDQSATDYLYIQDGGAKVQTSDKVKEKSGEIANKTSAGLFAKLSWLPFLGGEGATEIDTNLGHKSNRFRQLFLALRLRFGGHAFLDSLAGDQVDALGISALPTAAGLFTDAALAVGSFLCHL